MAQHKNHEAWPAAPAAVTLCRRGTNGAVVLLIPQIYDALVFCQTVPVYIGSCPIVSESVTGNQFTDLLDATHSVRV